MNSNFRKFLDDLSEGSSLVFLSFGMFEFIGKLKWYSQGKYEFIYNSEKYQYVNLDLNYYNIESVKELSIHKFEVKLTDGTIFTIRN